MRSAESMDMDSMDNTTSILTACLIAVGAAIMSPALETLLDKHKDKRGFLWLIVVIGFAMMVVAIPLAINGAPPVDRINAVVNKWPFLASGVTLGTVYYAILRTIRSRWEANEKASIRKKIEEELLTCRYLHDPVETTADMDKIIRESKGQLDWLLISGDSVARFWLKALEYAAQNASSERWKIRVILMKPDTGLCTLASMVTGTSGSAIHQQIGDVRQKLDKIKHMYPNGIEIKLLNRLPPCTMWLATDGIMRRVNIETLFSTDNGDGPVFRCTDRQLFDKCTIEFDALWTQAQ